MVIECRLLVLLLFLSEVGTFVAFQLFSRPQARYLGWRQCGRLRSHSSKHDDIELIREKSEAYFSKSSPKFLTVHLSNHKPLGCSAEECLKVDDDGFKHVFVSKVVEGGNADKGGILTNDVIVGISGSFEDVEDVFGLGLTRVRSLIAGRSADKTLTLCIVRGTDVSSKHDTALVDLCILPEDKDVVMTDCIKSLYDASRDDLDISSNTSTIGCDDKDTECMIDALFNNWDENIIPVTMKGPESESDVEEKSVKKRPAPWESRSSPSGTYVQDPKTGKLVNIDEID